MANPLIFAPYLALLATLAQALKSFPVRRWFGLAPGGRDRCITHFNDRE